MAHQVLHIGVLWSLHVHVIDLQSHHYAKPACTLYKQPLAHSTQAHGLTGPAGICCYSYTWGANGDGMTPSASKAQREKGAVIHLSLPSRPACWISSHS